MSHSRITAPATFYQRYFKLSESPFALPKDDSHLFSGQSYSQGIAQFMSFALELRSGLGILTGDTGVGKTTLIKSLTNMLPRQHRVIGIPANIPDTKMLLQTIYQKLGLGIASQISKSQFTEIYQYLAEKFRSGQKVIFWIDDAHLLSPVILENVIRLSNNDISCHNILQFILSGGPQLNNRIAYLRLTGVPVKIGFKYVLNCLDRGETEAYIIHHLKTAGCLRTEQFFSQKSFDLIYHYSGGVIGQINAICREALHQVCCEKGSFVSPGIIEKAALRFKNGGPPAAKPRSSDRPQPVSDGRQKAVRAERSPRPPEAASNPPKAEQRIRNYSILKYQPRIPGFSRECFRDVEQVATNLALLTPSRELKMIGIISSAGGEGTSTLAAMLAHVIAHSLPAFKAPGQNSANGPSAGQGRILLVDAHLQKPAQHKIFGSFLKPGLTDLLTGIATPSEVIRGFTNIPLNLLTTGELLDNPGRGVLPTDKLKSLLDMLKLHYDYILIDLPPVLHSPQGRKLSQLCDAVMLVIQAGVTRYPVVQKAAEMLAGAGVPVLGGVLNRRKFYIPDHLYRKL